MTPSTRSPIDRRREVHLAFTAHSIPMSMARNCQYEHQLTEACRLIAEEIGVAPRTVGARLPEPERAAGRSVARAGYPRSSQRLTARVGSGRVVIHPVGFLSDHMEVLYDLDEEARLVVRGTWALTWSEPGPSAPIPDSSVCSAS